MKLSARFTHSEVYDVIGVGFGPAGIALAAAMEDATEAGQGDMGEWKALFLEQAPDSSWQPQMLLPGTDIQHHFLRDFATPRNPRSRFTFPNYLKEQGRLFQFGMLGGNPGRIEWNDYVKWVAKQLSHYVLYRHQVMAIEPVLGGDGSPLDLVRVKARDASTNESKEFYTRNLVLNTGRIPNVPTEFKPLLGPRVFHSTQYLGHISQMPAGSKQSFAVIGSGQNAIEVILHLADRHPDAEIHSINRRLAFRIYDLGHFSNEVYFPEHVDYFYNTPRAKRGELFDDIKFTNYSSVDFDVSRALYWKTYEESIQGKHRIHVLKWTQVVQAAAAEGQYRLSLEDTYHKSRRVVTADAVILCTGLMEESFPATLAPLRSYVRVEEDETLSLTRNYQVVTTDHCRVGIFVNGLTERTHGISDAASFSMMALKAQRILETLELAKCEQPGTIFKPKQEVGD